jgi:hypothetical protein
MSEKKEFFVDSIGRIHFTGGMVRFDMCTLEPSDEGKEPVLKEKARIIMPPDGFLATFNTMQRLIDQLLEKGVLKKREDAAPKK